jgi:hypothetical protein
LVKIILLPKEVERAIYYEFEKPLERIFVLLQEHLLQTQQKMVIRIQTPRGSPYTQKQNTTHHSL